MQYDLAVQHLSRKGSEYLPCFNTPQYHPVGGRHYHRGPKGWVSFEHSAWLRRVSLYQFFDSCEWFAEVYRAYYEVGPSGIKGERLAQSDPATKAWFEMHIAERS